MTLSSSALELDPLRPDRLAQGRILDRRLAADLVDAGELGGALGGSLAEPFLARSARCQHPALAPIPGRVARRSPVVSLPKSFMFSAKHVVHGLVSRVDQAQVGIAVEHPQQEVGIARLAHGQESNRLAQGRVDGLALRA